MSNSQNRARVRARSKTSDSSTGTGLDALPRPLLQFALATRPEAALIGWSTASAAGVAERPGPQTDHMAALVRRARRREAMRRMMRLWAPRRQPDLGPTARTSLSLGPSESSLRAAVQTGLSVALPRESAVPAPTGSGASDALLHMAERRRGDADRRYEHSPFAGPERRRSRAAHPAGRRLPEQRALRAGVREL